ncbi:hypothetical protein BpHYR1_005903 [Brachionus plicatilis]|uniref:Uncharacterized protein n=1 Tax=Brachionus plicatilis TaxID=10195 RepID=A0A3M7QNE4_BRAPC|nr:hypothetical protein BpHYR1_005903 [Brachionus plicatilis]
MEAVCFESLFEFLLQKSVNLPYELPVHFEQFYLKKKILVYFLSLKK